MGDHGGADASGFEIGAAEEPVDDGADEGEFPVWRVAETEVDGAGDGADDEQRGGSIVHGFAQRPEDETTEEELLAERDYGEDTEKHADGVERKQPPRGVWRAGLEDAKRVGDEEAGRHGLEEVLRSDAPLGFCGNEAEAYAFGFAEQQDCTDGEADPHEVAEDVETEAGDGVGVDLRPLRSITAGRKARRARLVAVLRGRRMYQKATGIVMAKRSTGAAWPG